MPAWLALEPVVLISRPISWATNPSFLPQAGGLGGHGLAEVVDVFLQAHLLLGDVEFLEVVDEFLLEAVVVDLFDGGVGHVLLDALLGGVDAFALEGGNLAQLLLDEVDVLVEVHLEDAAFVGAELVAEVDGALEGGGGLLPLLVADFVGAGAVPDIAHGSHGVEDGGMGHVEVVGHVGQGVVAGHEEVAVEAGVVDGGVLLAEDAFHFAALQDAEHGADVQLMGAVGSGDLDDEVELLAVEGFDFYVQFFVAEGGLHLGIAGH